MTPQDQYLFDYAADLGVTIVYQNLPADRDGEYDHDRREIHIRPNLHARHHRSVLAHELAHATFGHVRSKFGPVNMKQEAQAERWAARHLIDVEKYRLAELINATPGAIAIELGVMTSTVLAFQTTYA